MQELVIAFNSVALFVLYIMMKIKKQSSSASGNPTGKESSPPVAVSPAKNQNKQNSPNSKKSGNCPITVLCRRMAGSNWENAPESKQPTPSDDTVKSPSANSRKKNKNRSNNKQAEKWTKFVAMDCEMVGVGSNGQDDMLARVSVVNENCDVLIDKYVKAQMDVVDYRTKVSGIRPHNMENGEDFLKVQQEVRQILQNKVLVGHSVKKDLTVLAMKHPYRHIRDTAKYRPLAKLVSNGATPSLKRLSKAILGMDIQTGEHSSVEDARASMLIYKRFSAEWERYLKKLNHHRTHNGRHRS